MWQVPVFLLTKARNPPFLVLAIELLYLNAMPY
jgi:hypothetical protein